MTLFQIFVEGMRGVSEGEECDDDVDLRMVVPIVELNESNLNTTCYNSILHIIQSAHFCSIDLELSGLGGSSSL